jgi:hypothetical protein
VKTIYLTLTSQYSQGYVHYRYANAIASSAVATPTTCGP